MEDLICLYEQFIMQLLNLLLIKAKELKTIIVEFWQVLFLEFDDNSWLFLCYQFFLFYIEKYKYKSKYKYKWNDHYYVNNNNNNNNSILLWLLWLN